MKNSFLLSIISLPFVAGIQFYINLDIAKNIGVEQFGIFAMLLIIMAMVQSFSDFGYYNFFLKSHDLSKFDVLTFYGGSSIIISCIFIIIFSFFDYALVSNELVFGYIFLLIFLPSGVVFLQSREKLWVVAVVDIISYLIGLWIYLKLSFLGVESYFVSMVIVLFVKNLFIWGGVLVLKLPDDRRLIARIVDGREYAKWQLMERGLLFFSLRSDHFLISYFVGGHFYGLYSFSWNFATQVNYKVIPIVTRIAFIKFSKAESLVESFKVIKAMIFIVSMVSAPIFVVLIFNSSEILKIMGGEWIDGYFIFSVVALSFYLRLYLDFVNCYFTASGTPYKSFKWVVFWGGSNFIFILIGVLFDALLYMLIVSSLYLFVLTFVVFYHVNLNVFKIVFSSTAMFFGLSISCNVLLGHLYVVSDLFDFVGYCLIFFFIYMLISITLFRRKLVKSIRSLG